LKDPVGYLTYLRTQHLLAGILPEFASLVDLSQTSNHHTEDAFIHTLNVATNLPKDRSKELLLAALFHDTGKVSTRTWDEEKGVFHFYGHEKESADIFGKICQRFGWANEDFDIDVTLWLILNHDRIKLTWSRVKNPKRTLRRILFAGGGPLDVGDERWVELIDLAEADIRGSAPSDPKTTDVKIAELNHLRRFIKEVVEKRKLEEQERLLDEKVRSIWNGHSVLRHFSAEGPEVGRLVRSGQDYARTRLRNGVNVTEDQVLHYLASISQE